MSNDQNSMDQRPRPDPAEKMKWLVGLFFLGLFSVLLAYLAEQFGLMVLGEVAFVLMVLIGCFSIPLLFMQLRDNLAERPPDPSVIQNELKGKSFIGLIRYLLESRRRDKRQ